MSSASATPSAISSVKALKPDLHRDERGWLFEIVNAKTGIDPCQVYAVLCDAITPRGQHHHERKTEVFAVTWGICRLRLRDMRTGDRSEIVMGPTEGTTVVVIPPGVWHEFQAIETMAAGPRALVIAVADEWYDPEDEDTHYAPGVMEYFDG